MPRRAAPFLLALLLPTSGLAQDRFGLRVGEHPGFGRVVIDAAAGTGYRVEEEEGRVVLRLAVPALIDASAARRMPRNVRGIEAEGGVVTVAVAPGARLRHFRLGSRIVLDLMDAQGEAQPPPAATAARQRPAASPPEPRAQDRVPPAAVDAPAVPPPREPAATPEVAAAPPAPKAPVEPVAAEPVPRVVEARPVTTRLVIPAGPAVGAALLSRGETWLLVLDAPLALDLPALRAGPFAETQVFSGSQATILRIPGSALPELRLARGQSGWVVEAGKGGAPPRPILPEADPGPPARLLLRTASASNSIAVVDPETGGTLLVGTVRDGGEATPFTRRGPGFEILETRLGAAILPRADTVSLRAVAAGFAADPGPGFAVMNGLAASAEATGMSRLFDLPDLPLADLAQRERIAVVEVAAAPPLARGARRLRHAEALLALGLGPEAQAMVALAMREDPHAAEDPRAKALQGAAALVAGRPAEAGGLLDPRLPGSDELHLWRGLLAAARGEEGGARRIAASVALMRVWPEPLRNRLGPLAAEALASGGEAAAARRLLAGREDDAAFALARAQLLEAEGEKDLAAAAYEAVTRGRDRRMRAAAMRRMAELRLDAGEIDAAGAASALEAALVAWRGDAMESETRIRLAELRQQAGDAKGAFDLLRETASLFPDLGPRLRAHEADALLAAIEREQPVAAVALFDTHAALLPAGEKTERALAMLADRLAALDLVDRARRVLRHALARAPDSEARGRVGLRLARMALEAGDAAGARTALAETDAPQLAEPLRQARTSLEARALVRLGQTEDAIARYRDAGPEAAPELAELLAARKDWAGAAAVLRAHLAATLPPPPEPLPEPSRSLVARTAALLTLAGDEEALAALRESEGARMSGGTFGAPFALLTAARLAGPGDLPRLRRELELARALPAKP